MVSPAKLAHLVIQSHDPGGLAKWYADLLGAKIVFESPAITLVTYDEEHHRIGFATLPPAEGTMTHRVAGQPGDLSLRVRLRVDQGPAGVLRGRHQAGPGAGRLDIDFGCLLAALRATGT